MKRILLDTSAYSEMNRGRLPQHVIREAHSVILSPIVIGELELGFRRGTRLAQNRQYLDRFLADPAVSVCPVTRETGECYGEILDGLLRRGAPLPTNDLWIAASALEFGLTVVTFDAHFREIPQVRTDVYPRA